MKRRSFIKAAASFFGLTSITGLYTWQIEPFWLEFVHLPMPVKNLPNNLVNKTLIQISDIHVGKIVRDKFLIKSFKSTTALNPAIIVYTGDFIHYEDENDLVKLEKMAAYFPKGSLKTLAVLGNHDYGNHWAEDTVANKITAILENQGITVLRNQQANINGLKIIGIDDYWGTNFFPDQAFKNYDNSKAAIVLCHNPDVCDLPIWNNFQGWILSGHTHGGQVKPPFYPPPILPVKNKRYTQGLIEFTDGRKLYINRALGHLKQLRFNVRPEITVFTLEQA